MIVIPADLAWMVLAVFIGNAAYQLAEIVTRMLLQASSEIIDDWQYHQRAKHKPPPE